MENEKRIKTTLGEYGDQLPIGIQDSDGKITKDIVTKKWRTKDERELGKKFANCPTEMPKHVSIIVSNMCEKLGPHNMDSLSDKEKKLVVSMMYFGDVFYVYSLLRMKTMGKNLKLQINCPFPGCDAEFKYVADLSTLDVVYVNNIEDMIWQYELEDPIELRGNMVEKFQLSYPKWEVLERNSGNLNSADVKIAILINSIIGLNDSQEPIALAQHELDDLSKPDFENLVSEIDDRFIGPNMSVEGVYPEDLCQHNRSGNRKFVQPIRWEYQNFFGHSSR